MSKKIYLFYTIFTIIISFISIFGFTYNGISMSVIIDTSGPIFDLIKTYVGIMFSDVNMISFCTTILVLQFYYCFTFGLIYFFMKLLSYKGGKKQ